MRSRTLREGSAGLLILLGLAVLGGLILWIRGFNPKHRSYRVTVMFPDIAGMQVGAPVRYRGVVVGKIAEVRPAANSVEVDVDITPATLIIPRDVTVQVNQSGLISETAVDFTPNSTLSPELAASANPLSPDCKTQPILCDGTRLQGSVGISFNQLIVASTRFAELFSNPQFFSEIRDLTRNTSSAAAGVATLTGEVTGLTRSVQRELGTLSAAATKTTTSVGVAANQIGLTAAQVNELLDSNRSTLISTLDNINRTSGQLETLVNRVSPAIEDGQLIQNLQTLSANAAQASANLRNLTNTASSPETVLMLQQTLDSARATFQNAQKITADLDELTGDPTFRQNLRNLVNGLGNLVSSTNQLQQQAALAQVIPNLPHDRGLALNPSSDAQSDAQSDAPSHAQSPASSPNSKPAAAAAAVPAADVPASLPPATFNVSKPIESLDQVAPQGR